MSPIVPTIRFWLPLVGADNLICAFPVFPLSFISWFVVITGAEALPTGISTASPFCGAGRQLVK